MDIEWERVTERKIKIKKIIKKKRVCMHEREVETISMTNIHNMKSCSSISDWDIYFI